MDLLAALVMQLSLWLVVLILHCVVQDSLCVTPVNSLYDHIFVEQVKDYGAVLT